MKLSYRNDRNARILSSLYDKPLDKPDWFKINADIGEEVEILVYDAVGWPWLPAEMLVDKMNEYKGRPLVFGINSPGGDVIDSIAIYQAMKRHDATVRTRIDSIAASSASVIALGGEEVLAYKSSTFMVHNPWTIAIGNAYDMEEVRDILKMFGSQFLDIYLDKASIGKRAIKALMDGKEKRDGTWMEASEAKEHGFIDRIIDGESKVKARLSMPLFAGMPDDVFKQGNQKATDIRSAEKALRDVGFSQAKAKAILSRGWNGNQRDAESIKDADGCLKSLMAKLK